MLKDEGGVKLSINQLMIVVQVQVVLGLVTRWLGHEDEGLIYSTVTLAIQVHRGCDSIGHHASYIMYPSSFKSYTVTRPKKSELDSNVSLKAITPMPRSELVMMDSDDSVGISVATSCSVGRSGKAKVCFRFTSSG